MVNCIFGVNGFYIVSRWTETFSYVVVCGNG